MTKEEQKEEEKVECKEGNEGDVKESTEDETAKALDNITNQVKEIKISQDDLKDLTDQVGEIKISDGKKELSDECQKTERQHSIEEDGKKHKSDTLLRRGGPNGGAPCDNYNVNYQTQPELKLSGSNKRCYTEESEPYKYSKPVNNYGLGSVDQMSQMMTFQNADQFGGGTVNIKQSPIIQPSNIDPFKLDSCSFEEGSNLVDIFLETNQFSNINTEFPNSINNISVGNLGLNMDNALEEGSPYNKPGPPSNQSDTTDSGISGMSVASPYQEMYSPQSYKSNASPPHEFCQDIPVTLQQQMNIPQIPLQTTCGENIPVNDPLAGREEELSDALEIIQGEIRNDSRKSKQVKSVKEVPVRSPNQPIHMMPQNPQQQFHPQSQRPVCQNPIQQPKIVSHIPVTTNQIIIPPGMIQSFQTQQPQTVVQSIPVSNCSNPIMMVPPNQGAIPVGPMPNYTQPQIIIIQSGPLQTTPKRPVPRHIAPKTQKQVEKKSVLKATENKGQPPKQLSRNEQVPVMSVRPTQVNSPSNGFGQPRTSNINNSNINVQKRNLLNVARRMVAEIPREQLAYQDEEGDTYLHVAACNTDTNLIQALLERLTREGMDWLIDLENKKRMTPLYLTVLGNEPEMVDVFLQNGANPNSMAQSISSDGKSMEVKAPIHVAASGGEESLPTLKKLLNIRDITLNIANSEGHTALHTAIIAHGTRRPNGNYINSLNTIETLIKAGADPNSQDKKSGKTPLMYAIEKRDYILIEKMLRLFDPKKLRNVIKSQTFDGSNCLKIAEGRKSEFNPQDWQRLWDLLNKACTGELPRVMLGSY